MEEPVDAGRRIVDCHHHLWPAGEGLGSGPEEYLYDALLADRGAHHNITETVFIECHVRHRVDGPEAMRPVGETEFVAGHARGFDDSPSRLAGIVATADLTRGDAVDEVLAAHETAGEGRFRGIRQAVYSCPELTLGASQPRPGLLADAGLRRGLTRLGANGYTFDAFVLHPQLPELADAACAVGGTTFVLNHLGGPLNIGPFADREETRRVWRQGMHDVASCDNVVLKLGGVGMGLFSPVWNRREVKPGSDEVVAHWRDDIRWCIDTFGTHRCMFESNFPVDRSLIGYAELWNAFQKIAATYSEAEQDLLFAGNASRVYRITAEGAATPSPA